ncbi:hypothetical protein HYI36_05135 [Bacillus sp. Gen3]|nr:hypothetical protein [Bacillus sp. Gen3]
MDRYTMMFQIAMTSNYSDDYLLTLSDEKLEKLYKAKVEHHVEVQSKKDPN